MKNGAGLEVDENGCYDTKDVLKAVHCALLFDCPDQEVYNGIMDALKWMANKCDGDKI